MRTTSLATLVLFLALSACGLKDEIERKIEDQAASVISEAVNDPGDLAIGQEIPQGYPEQDFPVYGGSASHVLGGFRQDLEGVLTYHLVLGTDDAPGVVEEHLAAHYREKSSEFEAVYGGGMFLGTLGEWQYAIVVSDGTADGYGTLITYTLSRE